MSSYTYVYPWERERTFAIWLATEAHVAFLELRDNANVTPELLTRAYNIYRKYARLADVVK